MSECRSGHYGIETSILGKPRGYWNGRKEGTFYILLNFLLRLPLEKTNDMSENRGHCNFTPVSLSSYLMEVTSIQQQDKHKDKYKHAWCNLNLNTRHKSERLILNQRGFVPLDLQLTLPQWCTGFLKDKRKSQEKRDYWCRAKNNHFVKNNHFLLPNYTNINL